MQPQHQTTINTAIAETGAQAHFQDSEDRPNEAEVVLLTGDQEARAAALGALGTEGLMKREPGPDDDPLIPAVYSYKPLELTHKGDFDSTDTTVVTAKTQQQLRSYLDGGEDPLIPASHRPNYL